MGFPCTAACGQLPTLGVDPWLFQTGFRIQKKYFRGPEKHHRTRVCCCAFFKTNRMQRHVFRLERPHVELHQLLKLIGIVDSGGAGKHLVASGEVFVDGVQELRKTAKLQAGQVVRVGEQEIVVVGLDR